MIVSREPRQSQCNPLRLAHPSGSLVKKLGNCFSVAVKKMGAVTGAHGNTGSQEAS